MSWKLAVEVIRLRNTRLVVIDCEKNNLSFFAAVYLTLLSPAGDRLNGLEVSPDVAVRAAIHITLTGPDGQKSMREVDALDLPPGQSVAFRPGENHIMLTGLAQPLQSGGHLDLTLKFEKAVPEKVRVSVMRN